jgi:hypothetical protein
MHYSPARPILRSYDLVNWEYAGHSVPSLDFGSNALQPHRRTRVRQGIWASTLNYRRSNSTYYLIRLRRVQPHLRLHGLHSGRCVVQAVADQQLLLLRRPARRRQRHHVRRLRPTPRSASPNCRPTGSARYGPSRSTPRRRASARWRARASTSATATTTSGSPARPTSVRPALEQPVGARTRRVRSCSTCPARSPGGGGPAPGRASCRPRTVTGTTWRSSTPTPAAACRHSHRSRGPPTGGPPFRPSTAPGAPRTRSRTSRATAAR